MTNDRVAVVTGANAGLGFRTALELARSGMTVVLACRSQERARSADEELHALAPDARTIVIPLDVSEPESIRAFGPALAERCGRLDVLVNNAGIVAAPLSRNSAGHEMHLATNYLGAFALTGTLLPLLSSNAGARIVNVGSLGHRLSRLDLDDPDWQTTPYNPWKAYFRSKVAILTFTIELARRLGRGGSGVIALAAHPGFAATEVARNSGSLAPKGPLGRWLNARIEPFIPTPADASRPIVHAALAPDARGGEYYGPSGFLEIGGAPGPARLNKVVHDAETGRRLWTSSEEMTGVRYLSD